MNYEDLRHIQRTEKNSALVPIDKEFYTKLAELVGHYKARARDTSEDAKLFDNVLKISKDIFERREQKILQKALIFAKTGKAEREPLTPEETAFFNALVACFHTSRDDFEAALAGDLKREAQKLQHINDLPGLSEPEDLNYVLVRIIKKVPKFVSDGLKECGPYEENEVVRIPKKEAELLASKNFAEKI